MSKRVLSQVEIIDKQFREIKHLVSSGAIASAKLILERISNEFPKSSSELTYLRARMYEDGVFGKQDIDAALEDFTFLMHGEGTFVGEGLVGRARMLYKKDPVNNTDEVLALCTEAADLDSNPMAMMLMASVFEHTKHDLKSAKKWCLRAFRNGSSWGLRYYALMLYRKKSYIRGILCELAATALSPFMIMRFGSRGPYK